jgi:hypothetical protein
MKRTVPRAACLSVLAAMLLPSVATASTSNAVNWSTQGEAVVCGVADGIEGIELDPGTGAPLDGLWPGLQCQTTGIPHGQGIGDPAVQLGQGRAGRARLVDISQDDFISDAPFVALGPGWVWKHYGIACTVNATSIRCTNGPGYGFTMSPGHVHLFSPTSAPASKNCGSVNYTFPHTGGHAHAALNNLTAVAVSCVTARSVAHAFLVTGKPPKSWHATLKTVVTHIDGQANTVSKEIFIRGKARVTGDVDN